MATLLACGHPFRPLANPRQSPRQEVRHGPSSFSLQQVMQSSVKDRPGRRRESSQAKPLILTTPRAAFKQFPTVTLVCVDGRSPVLALRAIHDSTARAGCQFARNIVFTTAEPRPGRASFQVASVPNGVEVIAQDRLDSIEGYNEFMMKRLISYIETDFALIVQWDGFVLNPANWMPAFLEYDYIGAVWPWQPPAFQVGNGGFSLRSKKLLQALQDPRVVSHQPEDLAICQTYRHLLEREFDIHFAPPKLADRFSFERHPHQRSFGFHGFYNFARVFSTEDLRQRLAELPLVVYGSIDATELAHNLSLSGDEASAVQVLSQVLRFRHGSEVPGEFQSGQSRARSVSTRRRVVRG